MKFKKIFILAFLGCCVALTTGCWNNKNMNVPADSAGANLNSLVTTGVVQDQFAMPNVGDMVAKISVEGYGDIWCRFFPEAAPKAVNNFISLAKAGKYNGVKFHRVIKNFMIQTGGNSDSIYREKNEPFPHELNQSLRQFSGALCMASTGNFEAGQSCQFYIVTSDAGKTADLNDVQATTKAANLRKGYNLYPNYTEKDKKLYSEHGGYPSGDMIYTVFGQVFDPKSMEVVKKISECKIKEQMGFMQREASTPDPDVILKEVTIQAYNGEV